MTRKLIISFLLLSCSVLTWAGEVRIENKPPNSTIWLLMHADFNVRFLPDTGHENSYVSMATNSLGDIIIYGYDALQNRSFFCRQISAGNPEVEADQITQLHTNGTKLFTHISVSNNCDDIEIQHDTRVQEYPG